MGNGNDVATASARRWVRDRTVLWRWTGSGAMVLPQKLEDPVALNGTAAAIWEVLDRPRSLAETTAELSTLFEIEEEQIQGHVLEAVTQMAELGVLTEIHHEETDDGR